MSGQDQPARRRSRRLGTYIVPASEWAREGYDTDAAQALESLQREIQKQCEGEGNASASVVGRRKIEIDGGVCLLGGRPGDYLDSGDSCNDPMLPHWTKLAKWLGQAKIFDVCNLRLSSQVWDTLFSSLSKSCHLRELRLSFVGLGRDGYRRLSSFLRHTTSLRELRLLGETIPDPDVAGTLSDAMRSHSTLQLCGFMQCGQSDTRILRRILPGCDGLENLFFAYERLGSGGVASIAEFISNNCRLEVLELPETDLSDDDALVLAQSVKKNEHLHALNLYGEEGDNGNNITDAARKPLMDMMFDTSSMKSIANSMHSCMIVVRGIDGGYGADGLRGMPPLERNVILINGEQTWSREKQRWVAIPVGKKIRMKVVMALCGDGSIDIKHLDGISMKLMPRCLELIQARREDLVEPDKFPSNVDKYAKYALSRVFEVMRTWEMPSLFENLGASSAEAGRKRKRRNISH